MISEEKCFIAECDNCGDLFENYHGYTLFVDETVLTTDLSEGEWYIDEQENPIKHYCPKCYSINDEDKLVVDKNRKKVINS